MGGAGERLRHAGQNVGRLLHFPTGKKEEEGLHYAVDTRINRGGILLPVGSLGRARELVNIGYDRWVEEHNGDFIESLASLVRQDVVGALTPREIKIPGNPDYIVFYPNRPGITVKEIVDEFGGEVGVTGVITTALSPQTQGKGVNLDDVFQRIEGVGIQGFNAGAVVEGLRRGDVSVPLTSQEEGPEVHMGLGMRGVRFLVQPCRDDYIARQIPAFGEEKRKVLAVANDIKTAFINSPVTRRK